MNNCPVKVIFCRSTILIMSFSNASVIAKTLIKLYTTELNNWQYKFRKRSFGVSHTSSDRIFKNNRPKKLGSSGCEKTDY